MIKVLLMSTFLLLSRHQGTAQRELPGVKDYEVVYPQKLHILHKRDTAGNHNPSNGAKYDDSMQYEIKVNGEKVILHLEKISKDLFAKDYSETHYSHDGREVTTSPEVKDHCFYDGHIQNDNDSEASISACHGLKGYFKRRGQRYLIQPLKLADSEEHAVFKYENLENVEDPKTCGVTNTTWELEDPIKKSSRSSTSLEKQEYLKARKYVEIYIVVDNAVYRKYNHNTTNIRTRVYEIINYINMVYKAINVHVALIGLEIWTSGDPFIVSSSAGTTLDRFSEWRQSNLLKRKKNDNAQLLTGIDLDGPTVGLAFVGTMCSVTHSSGIIQDHHTNSISIGATMAHEMGHNFGMNHDTSSCKCSSASCIMAAQLSYNTPKDFSTCSLQEFQKYILDRTGVHHQYPFPNRHNCSPVCGNNFVEKGEECDCGTPEECTNVCCEAATCKLKLNVKCGFGECCENCQLKKAGTVCRVKKHDCDLPELCTGWSHECPVDRFRVNGYPCQDEQGYCYMGKCPTLQSQCVALWGPGSTVAADLCYMANQNGVYYGHCRKGNGTFIPCAKKDIKCGKLFCTGGSRMPTDGNLLSFDSCKGSFPNNNNNEDTGMVATGTKCGDEMVCSRGQCVEIESAYKSTNCSTKCKGHAVCDHELQCQCEEGWAPPDCDSATTVTHFAIIASVLAALAVIVIVVALFFYYRNTKKKQSHSGQSRGISGETNLAFSGHDQKRRQNGAPRQPRQEINDTGFLLPNPPPQANKPQVCVNIPEERSNGRSAYHQNVKTVAKTKSTPSPVPKGRPPPPPQALKPPVQPRV